jgi:hypothetical protein
MEGKRRASGAPERVFRHRSRVTDQIEHVYLPCEPIVAAMYEHYAAMRANGHPEWCWDDLARAIVGDTGPESRAHVQTLTRTMHRYRSGESHHIRLDIADKIAVAIGVPLSLLYPLEETS